MGVNSRVSMKSPAPASPLCSEGARVSHLVEGQEGQDLVSGAGLLLAGRVDAGLSGASVSWKNG